MNDQYTICATSKCRTHSCRHCHDEPPAGHTCPACHRVSTVSSRREQALQPRGRVTEDECPVADD